MTLALALLGCTPSPTLASVTGEITWMEADHRGLVTATVEASEVALGVLRRHDLQPNGTFQFDELPVGELQLDVYTRVGTWACDDQYSGLLGPEGLHLVFDSWSDCHDTGFE